MYIRVEHYASGKLWVLSVCYFDLQAEFFEEVGPKSKKCSNALLSDLFRGTDDAETPYHIRCVRARTTFFGGFLVCRHEIIETNRAPAAGLPKYNCYYYFHLDPSIRVSARARAAETTSCVPCCVCVWIFRFPKFRGQATASRRFNMNEGHLCTEPFFASRSV